VKTSPFQRSSSSSSNSSRPGDSRGTEQDGERSERERSVGRKQTFRDFGRGTGRRQCVRALGAQGCYGWGQRFVRTSSGSGQTRHPRIERVAHATDLQALNQRTCMAGRGASCASGRRAVGRLPASVASPGRGVDHSHGGRAAARTQRLHTQVQSLLEAGLVGKGLAITGLWAAMPLLATGFTPRPPC